MKKLLPCANCSTDDPRGLERWEFQSCRSCPFVFASFTLTSLYAPFCFRFFLRLSPPFLTLFKSIRYSFIIEKNHTKRRARGPGGNLAGHLVLCARGGGQASIQWVWNRSPSALMGDAFLLTLGVVSIKSDQGCKLLNAASVEVLKYDIYYHIQNQTSILKQIIFIFPDSMSKISQTFWSFGEAGIILNWIKWTSPATQTI